MFFNYIRNGFLRKVRDILVDSNIYASARDVDRIDSFLASPTIRVSSPESDTQFFVHRSLLQAQTNLLHSLKSRESHLALPSPASDKTISIFLEYLYTSNYNLPHGNKPHHKSITVNHDISLEDRAPLSPALTEEEEVHETEATFGSSPLLNAARLGSLGVWGKAPAIHSEFQSIHIEEHYEKNDRGKRPPSDSQYIKTEVTDSVQVHTPPTSPRIVPVKPVVRKGLRDFQLSGHVEVYRFAKAFHLPKLAHLAIRKLSDELKRREGLVLNVQIVELIKEAFAHPGATDSELKEFISAYAGLKLDELRQIPIFVDYIGKGGEFVIRLVEKVAARKGGSAPWV